MQTNIRLTLMGRTKNLEAALISDLCNYSNYRFETPLAIIGQLTVDWICETEDYDAALQSAMEGIDFEAIEQRYLTVKSIG